MTGEYRTLTRQYNPATGRFDGPDPAGFRFTVNPYSYGGNNPISNTDTTGLWFGLDDLVAIGGGALVGAASQLIGDALHGKLSTWQDVVGAGVGGAVVYRGLRERRVRGPAARLAGAAGNGTTQLLKMASGDQQEFDWASLGVATAAGAVGGGIGGTVFKALAGPSLQATFTSVVAAGATGGAGAGLISGGYQGAVQASQKGGDVFTGIINGAWQGAWDGALTGAVTGGLTYGGIKAVQYGPAYVRALTAEFGNKNAQTAYANPLEPFYNAAKQVAKRRDCEVHRVRINRRKGAVISTRTSLTKDDK